MCLETVDKKEVTDKIKKLIGKNGIKVYKMVAKSISRYYPLYQNTHIPFGAGRSEAFITTRIKSGKDRREDYQAGYHFWFKKEDAEKCKMRANRCCLKVIECTVKKSWITATGMNEMHYDTTEKKRVFGKTIVAKKAIFPEFKE